jgi:hypothetical protein
VGPGFAVKSAGAWETGAARLVHSSGVMVALVVGKKCGRVAAHSLHAWISSRAGFFKLPGVVVAFVLERLAAQLARATFKRVTTLSVRLVSDALHASSALVLALAPFRSVTGLA